MTGLSELDLQQSEVVLGKTFTKFTTVIMILFIFSIKLNFIYINKHF